MNAKFKRTVVLVALQAAMSCAVLSACSSSDDVKPPVPAEDAGGGSLSDVALLGDASSDGSEIVDAAIDRRRPGDGGDGDEPNTAIVHDVWAGSSVTCARVETDGAISTECWGNNRFGQLGRGEIATTNGQAFTPQPIQSALANDFVQIAVDQPACARSSDKTLRCWSHGYALGTPVTSTPPTDAFLTDVEDIQVGGWFACARFSNAQVSCWGRNSSGQLGLGYRDSIVHSAPEEIPSFTAEQISVGSDHACAVKEGEVWCWGSNSSGALGQLVPRFENSLSPGRVPNVTGIVHVVAGQAFTCALASDKTVWCWGDLPQASSNFAGTPVHMLEVGFDQNDPSPDRLLTDVEELVGSGGICVRVTSGAVKCLGTSGEMVGYPDWSNFRQTRNFTTVTGIDDAAHLVAGFDHVCALTQAGVLRCWGNNGQGQLGIDPLLKERSGLPVRVRF